VSWINGLIVALLSVLIGCLSAFYPESIFDVILPMFWAFVLVLGLYHRGQRSRDETWLKIAVFGGLLMRLPMVLAHLAMGFWIYKGELDFLAYFSSVVMRGQQVLVGNFESFEVPDLSSAASGRNVVTELFTLSYFLVGPSLPGVLLVAGAIGFLGSYFFLRAFQVQFPSCRETRFLAVSLFLFPSLAFWTSVIGKDSIMIFFLGLATYSLAHVLKAPRVHHVLGVVGSLTFITLIRAPVGLVLTFAIGISLVFAFHNRAVPILRPVVFAIVSLAVVGAIAVVSVSMRQYSAIMSEEASLTDNLVSLAVFKHVGLSQDPTAGGSSLPTLIQDPSGSGFWKVLPQTVFTFLFRPLVFEAHNIVAFVAAIESTFLFVLVLFRWRYLLGALRSVRSRPFSSFCFIAFLVLTVGLSFEANFGVIVRHRTMVLPFLFMLMAVPLAKRKSREGHATFHNVATGGRRIAADTGHSQARSVVGSERV